MGSDSQITGIQAGSTDQTARDAAAAAQGDIDTHEAEPHNTDTTARTNAATAQATAETARSEIDDHEANHPSGGNANNFGQLDGTWTFTFAGANISDGEAHYAAQSLVGEVDTWLFGATGTFQPSQARLLALEIGDEIEIRQSNSRHQTITLTEAPTDVAGDVRVMGTADRATATEIPSANASVTVTLAAGPMDAVDQTARDAAAAAQASADTAQTAADAKASASDIATAVSDHAKLPHAHHVPPVAAGGGGSTVERLLLTMPSSSYQHRIATALYFGTGESVWTIAYPAGHTLNSMTAAFKTGVVQRDTDYTTEIGPPCTEAVATQLWGYAPGGTIDEYRVDLTAGGIVLAIPSVATLPANQPRWLVRALDVGDLMPADRLVNIEVSATGTRGNDGPLHSG